MFSFRIDSEVLSWLELEYGEVMDKLSKVDDLTITDNKLTIEYSGEEVIKIFSAVLSRGQGAITYSVHESVEFDPDPFTVKVTSIKPTSKNEPGVRFSFECSVRYETS